MMSNMTTIYERTASLPKQGDASADSPVVSGVKVLGIESKNGRKYPIEVMRKALEKYEGAIVNIDHPAGSEPRSYEDRFGRLTNARMEADGIYADLAYNPKHPLAEGFQWWVKNDPKAIGLSHNAQAKTKMNQEGVEEIEEIVKVDSVDLVAEPATTAGLMECVMRARETTQPVVEADGIPWVAKILVSMAKYPAVGDWMVVSSKSGVAKDKKDAKLSGQTWVGSNIMGAKKDIGKNKAFGSTGFPEKLVFRSVVSDKSGAVLDEKTYSPVAYKKEAQANQVRGPNKPKELKPTKKLNVTEAKKRKAYKRMLVSEAIKEILTIRKGV